MTKAEKLFEFQIISPTRGKMYQAKDLIKKALDRADVGIEVKIQPLYQSGYGDIDGVIRLTAKIGGSVWTESIEGEIDMVIPYHTRMSGVFDGLEWGCGESYGYGPKDLRLIYGESLKIELSASLRQGEETKSGRILIRGYCETMEFVAEHRSLIEEVISRGLFTKAFGEAPIL